MNTLTNFENPLTRHEPFAIAERLIGLAGIESAVSLPFRMPPRDDAGIDRVLGIVEVADDASVHADFWECHPAGDELLCLLSGRLRATVAARGQPEFSVEIAPGEAFIVPRATWHRLQVIEPGRLLFCTAGAGSELCRRGSAQAPDGQRGAGVENRQPGPARRHLPRL